MNTANDCQEFRDLMSPYLDGDLEGRQTERLVLHLQECPACSRQMELLQKTVDLLKDLPEEPPPPEILDGVRKAIYRPGWASRWLGWANAPWVRALAPAMAMVVVVMSIIILQQRYPGIKDQAGKVTAPRVVPLEPEISREEAYRDDLSGEQPPASRPAPRTMEDKWPSVDSDDSRQQPSAPPADFGAVKKETSLPSEKRERLAAAPASREIAGKPAAEPVPSTVMPAKNAVSSLAPPSETEAPVRGIDTDIPPAATPASTPAPSQVRAPAPTPAPVIVPAPAPSPDIAPAPAPIPRVMIEEKRTESAYSDEILSSATLAEDRVSKEAPADTYRPPAEKELQGKLEMAPAVDKKGLESGHYFQTRTAGKLTLRESPPAAMPDRLLPLEPSPVGESVQKITPPPTALKSLSRGMKRKVSSTRGEHYLTAPRGYDYITALSKTAEALGGRIESVMPLGDAQEVRFRKFIGPPERGLRYEGSTIALSLPDRQAEKFLDIISRETPLETVSYEESAVEKQDDHRRGSLVLHIRQTRSD